MTDELPGRTDRWISLGIALGLFVVYTLGACRTIYVGDSGELVTAVHVLGIPHPSGYPLYVLLGKLWTLLVPVGSIAFRMSLFSASCAAATCGLVFVTVRQDGGSRTAGLLGAGLLAFAPSFWHESNIQRVYALNALFVVLALNRAFAWHRDRKPFDLVVTMLVCGLGASNHTVMALVGVAVAIWVPIVDPSLFRKPKIVGLCGAAFFAGLLPYVYLPIRSQMNPVLNWGEPSTITRFLDVVLRRDYWDRAWWEGARDLGPIAGDWAASLVTESGFVGIPLAAIALASSPVRKWLLPCLVLGLNLFAVARHGSFNDIFMWHRYYMPSYAMIALLAATGLEALRTRLQARRLAILILFVPLALFVTGFRTNDHSGPSAADAFAHRVLDSLPPGAKILTTDDNILFPLLYLKWVEHLRPDIELIPLGVDQKKQGFSFDPDIDGVFFTHHPNWDQPELRFIPIGVVFQAIRVGRPLPEPLPYRPLPGSEQFLERGDYLTRMLVAHQELMYALTSEQRDWQVAESHLSRAQLASPAHDLTHFNVGMLYARNGFFDKALESFDRANAINPRGGLNFAPGARALNAPRYSPAEQMAVIRRNRARASEAEQRLGKQFAHLRNGSPDWHLAMARALSVEGVQPAARRHRIMATGKPIEADPFGER